MPTSTYDFLFAPPWWMLVAGVAVAVGVFVYGNMRLNRRLQLGAAGLLVVVGVWFGCDRWVETPTEVADGGTRRFVQAVVNRDGATLGALLSPEVSLGRLGREDIRSAASVYADEWGLKSALVTGMDLDNRGTQIVVRIHVVSRHDTASMAGMDTLPTDWEFTWGRSAEGWQIVNLAPTKIGGADIPSVMRRFFLAPPGR